MGASGWKYICPFEPDLSALLDRLRQQVFADREFYWPDDPHSTSWEKTWPAEMTELAATDELRQTGTHSILDITGIAGEDDPDTFGALRPLRTEERQRYFGTDTPTRADFEAGYLAALATAPRWTGNFTTLYSTDGQPIETAIWGISGD